MPSNIEGSFIQEEATTLRHGGLMLSNGAAVAYVIDDNLEIQNWFNHGIGTPGGMNGYIYHHLTVRNVTTESREVEANSINRVLGLGVRQGHRIASGAAAAQARAALEALQALVESGFGESDAAPETESVLAPQPARPAEGEWIGEPASPGVGIGPVVRLM